MPENQSVHREVSREEGERLLDERIITGNGLLVSLRELREENLCKGGYEFPGTPEDQKRRDEIWSACMLWKGFNNHLLLTMFDSPRIAEGYSLPREEEVTYGVFAAEIEECEHDLEEDLKRLNSIKGNLDFIPESANSILFSIIDPGVSAVPSPMKVPTELSESIEQFRKDHPHPQKIAFIMMRFGNTRAHNEIVEGIRKELAKHKISGIRADDKQYHDDLFWNILTYIYGCDFGIAVFERIEQEDFNPNVAFEVGYMMALKKPVLLLKDQTLKNLHVDLIGRLYRTFDLQRVSESVGPQIEIWLKDKGLIVA